MCERDYDKLSYNAKQRSRRQTRELYLNLAERYGLVEHRRIHTKLSILFCAKKECEIWKVLETELIAENNKLIAANKTLLNHLKTLTSVDNDITN